MSRGVDEGGDRGAVRGVDVRVSPGPFRLFREFDEEFDENSCAQAC